MRDAAMRLCAVVLALFAIRAAVPGDAALKDATPGLRRFISGTALVRAEFPSVETKSPALTLLTAELPYNPTEKVPEQTPPASEFPEDSTPPQVSPEDTATSQPPEATAPDGTDPEPSQKPEDPTVGTAETPDGGYYYHSAEGIYLKNKTDYDIDVSSLLASPLTIPTDGTGKVLIIHTHGTEAFTPDGDDVYTPTDPSRTTDEDCNVLRLGDELARILAEKGVTVIHDREYYDYPNYNGAYTRAWQSITTHLENDPDIVSVIDLHRDALEGEDGTVYKTVADVGDEPCAQVMLISGTNFSGLKHDGWQENLKFALRIQAQMVNQYPSLARPLNISQYRYNQHATPASLIVEVGCSGNTLQEALNAVRCFGDCLADVLTSGRVESDS